MSTTLIDVAVALTTTFDEIGDDVEVILGPLAGYAPQGDYLQVGAVVDDGEDKMTVERRWSSLVGNLAYEEDYTIVCYVDAVGDGDTERPGVVGRLQASYVIYERAVDRILADLFLGGLLISSATGALVSSGSARIEQTESGLHVGYTFTVEAQRVRSVT